MQYLDRSTLRNWVGAAISVLIVLLLLSCGGGGDDGPGAYGNIIAEQTDYFDGTTYHRYYRYTGYQIGYATSTDGISFDPYPGNPIMTDGVFPVLVNDNEDIYLIVKDTNTQEYRQYDISTPSSPSYTRTILRGDYCNMAVAVVDGVWHALIEGHSEDYFFLMHSIMEDGEFRSFRIVVGDAGNPTMTYIPERNAILALYGADYKATGLWRIRAATYDFSEWMVSSFVLEEIGHHLADPDIGIGQINQLIITAGYNQDSVNTYYFNGNSAELHDAIVSGHIEIDAERTNQTMKPE